ncbi:YhaN family protein [Celeribacter naphthalenivorans]|uniref:YhaN family protein n=1 Tax=Celeribacter naphthalenivorans TaxID=1614694 RepID=UPI001CFB7610|nr:YhaN family protein [Celeribacter naphthalenivorans]
MRIKRLSLDRFGHFTDRKFDFGSAAGGHDFHIIYGPNEAGKTTTMEAVLRLFYGFPLREGYAFKHARNNLQVSATLDIDGALRDFTRLPTRSGSLVDVTGTALPETALSGHLAGLSEEDYRRLLCLDDETIERGGEEIANAEGDIGRLLFSAAAGVADLSAVLDGVRARADALWKKRGRTTRVAELKRALAEVEKEIKERDVTASTWKALKRELGKAREAELNARATRDGLNAAKANTEAQRRALPLLAEILDLQQAVAPFATYPDHLDFNPERLIELRSDRGVATQNIARLTGEISSLTEERAELALDTKRLELSTALEALEDLSARDRTAQLDLGRRQDEQQAAENAMQQAARDLGIVSPDADLQRLVLSGSDIATLESARETLREAISREHAEAREVHDLQERLTRATEALQENTSAPENGQPVGDILVRFDADSLAPAHAAALQTIETAKVKLRRSLAALTFAEITFAQLPTCPTSRQQATDWSERHQELLQDLRITTDKRDEYLADAEARAAQASALAQDAQLVSDTEAEERRKLRDARWSTHLAALTLTSANDFYAAMQQHDIAADTRLAQSRELAQLREIGQADAEARARATQADKRRIALREECSAIETSVHAAASGVGLPNRITPAEWLDWVLCHGTARDDAQALRDTEEANRPILQRAAALMTELSAALPFAPADLGSALNTARRLAEDQRKQVDARTKAEDALRQAQRDLTRREDTLTEIRQIREAAETAWATLIQDLIGDALPPERLAASLEPLRALREHETTRTAAARRVSTMRADQTLFSQEVDALALAHDLAPLTTATDTFAALKSHAEQARMARKTALKLDDAIATAKTEKDRHQNRLDFIDQEVEAIAAFFPDPVPPRDIDALRDIATRAQKVIETRATLEKLTRQLLSELNTPDIEAAQARLAEVSAPELEAALDNNGSDLAHAEDALTRAIQNRVTAEHALADVKGDDAIALLAEQKATLELELEDAALEQLELSLGHHLASDAIRRYRDSHRSDMLTATEQCFASLTQGAYPSLSTQIDKETEVLLAVDGNGVSKRAAEMSKGTRFQLYLALRAAAHEQLVAQGTTLPFFCDDIFETFDEARTSAACRVMETIGARGQAIYLTHHRHVVEIAKSVCATPPIIHEL